MHVCYTKMSSSFYHCRPGRRCPLFFRGCHQEHETCLRNHKPSSLCLANVGPASKTMGQHWFNTVSICCIRWDLTNHPISSTTIPWQRAMFTLLPSRYVTPGQRPADVGPDSHTLAPPWPDVGLDFRAWMFLHGHLQILRALVCFWFGFFQRSSRYGFSVVYNYKEKVSFIKKLSIVLKFVEGIPFIL